MKGQNRVKGLLLILAAVVVIPMAVPTSAMAAKTFTATISPISAYSDGSTEYTVTITNTSGGNTQIGSAQITAPAGFTVSSIGTPTASESKPWTASLDSGVVTLSASGGNNKIGDTESVSITITAEIDRAYSVDVDPTTATVSPGGSTSANVSVGVDPEGDLTATWTVAADSDTPWTPPADWTISGSQPSVTINVPTVTLNASDVPDGVTITFDPETGTPPFDSTMTVDVGSEVAPGTYYITISVTYGDSELATTTFILIVDAPDAYEGLGHGFWKNDTDDWPAGYSPDDLLGDVFTNAGDFGLGNYTLLQTLGFQGGNELGDKARILLRNAVAAVLNAAHPDINYPLSLDDVIEEVNEALSSGDADIILGLEITLDEYNNLGDVPPLVGE
jgi:hypothetical protein